ncbi:hypothetical protein AX14_007711 [Amanita brunnescens Koide BX004]|nr:hypothetical protein AX14_007711 [Amanita brunnescens Koide BX004]
MPNVPSATLLPEIEIDALRLVWTANYAVVAACSLLVYDIILTSGREITYIWRAKWSFPKIVYLILRYYGAGFLAFITFSSSRYTFERCH